MLAGVAGIANMGILAVINTAASLSHARAVNLRLALMFGLAIILYVLAQRAVMVSSVSEVEKAIHRIRLRLVDMLQRTDLTGFERIGRSTVYAGITRETSTITQTAPALVIGVQSAVLLVFASIYIASLSLVGFGIGAAFTVIATLTQLRRLRQYRSQLHEAGSRENELFDRLSDILDGFKEVKMSARRARELFADASTASREVSQLRMKTQRQWVEEFIRIQVIFFLLPGTIVFLVPRFSSVPGEDIMKMTAAVLFLIGPIGYLGQSIQVVTILNVAAENIFALEKLLTEATQRDPAAPLSLRPRDFAGGFREIALERVTFQHRTDGVPGFTIGPIDLVVRANDFLFISGGNGSGKSTLIKVLAGLYRPTSGVMRVDGLPLADNEVQAYRDQISAIFADYHLFRRLYGVDPPTPERAQALLEELGLADKTRFVGDRFETVDLSAGQRKRLALMVALLEDKPTMIFDEWAAEQDPLFRARFYREILPRLHRAGKTLVVVTHDDRYFDVADRHLRMEYGVFVDTEEGRGRA